MLEVQSSMIHKAGYDPETKTLCVQFHNFAAYIYKEVTPLVFARLMNADSIGKFFTDTIKEDYDYEKVKAAEKQKKKPKPKKRRSKDG